MNSSYSDPVDHSRTSRRHAGETLTHGANAPGLAGVAVAVVALVIGLFELATGQLFVGISAGILAAVLGAGGGAWVLHTHRKVRDAELRWHADSGEPAPPPSS